MSEKFSVRCRFLAGGPNEDEIRAILANPEGYVS